MIRSSVRIRLSALLRALRILFPILPEPSARSVFLDRVRAVRPEKCNGFLGDNWRPIDLVPWRVRAAGRTIRSVLMFELD